MYRHTPETIEKIRQSKLGSKNPMYGKTRFVSEEERKQMSIRQMGSKNHMYGKKLSEERKQKARSYRHTEEARRKIIEAGKLRKQSVETRKKISKSNLGKKRSEFQKKKISDSLKGRTFSDNQKKNISLGLKGKIVSEETRQKIRIKSIGRKHSLSAIEKIKTARSKQVFSIESRRKMGESHSGPKSHMWKGGVTPINEKIRKSFDYKLWKAEVYRRDGLKCVICKKTNCIFEVDHIKPFALFPELRFDVNNGRVLCIDCHKKTPTYGGKSNKKNLDGETTK